MSTHNAVSPALAWLEEQDITEREDLSDPCPKWPWLKRFRRFETKKTSGSTGRPVRICKSMDVAAEIDATMWALYRWHGVEPGMRHARFWGLDPSGTQRVQTRVIDRFLRRYRLSASEFSQKSILSAFDDLREFQPVYIHAYPSLADEFCRVCEEAGRDGSDLGVKALFLTGELLEPRVRRRIAAFFDARVVNEYGCSEAGLLGFECEAEKSHLVPGTAWIELVNSKGALLPEGKQGEVVITDLYGKHRPLCRYRLGDLATIDTNSTCRCGRELPYLRIEAGRKSAFIVFPDGDRVLSPILSRSMPPTARRFKARQTSRSRLEIRIQPAQGADPESVRADCLQSLQRHVRNRLELEVIITDHIPPDRSGKLRYFTPLSETNAEHD